jgi:hypothetical protein
MIGGGVKGDVVPMIATVSNLARLNLRDSYAFQTRLLDPAGLL